MANSKFILHDTIKSLKKKQKDKAYLPIRDPLRALVLIGKGRPYWQIAEALGYSLAWVRKLSMDYTRDGLAGIMPKPHPGAEPLLSPDQLMELCTIILDGPGEDELLSRYRIADLQRIVKEKWGVEYSRSGMHALLQRMKFSHITTRPQNPKNDPEIMELWKKKPKSSLIRKRKSTAVSRSGTRTKPDSDKRGSATASGRSRVSGSNGPGKTASKAPTSSVP